MNTDICEHCGKNTQAHKSEWKGIVFFSYSFFFFFQVSFPGELSFSNDRLQSELVKHCQTPSGKPYNVKKKHLLIVWWINRKNTMWIQFRFKALVQTIHLYTVLCLGNTTIAFITRIQIHKMFKWFAKTGCMQYDSIKQYYRYFTEAK